MGQILGLGITHYPGLAFKGNLSNRINLLLADPVLPERLRSPENWPAPMREQWSDDGGLAHSDGHRQDMIDQFRRARQELDEFQPDFVVIWGDDQYENFKEDCVPAFAVLAYDGVEVRPWQHARGPNSWDEPADKAFTIKGHRAGGKYVAGSLIHQGFDVAYAYKPLHGPGLGHAIVNSVLYLDWDRRGFPYPVVPITVNSYGRDLVRAHGRPQTPSETLALEGELDPHGPQPWRCFQLGGAVARAVAASPWKVALIASSIETLRHTSQSPATSASYSRWSDSTPGYIRACLGTRNECDQLDEATSATRHGLWAAARATAAPSWKHRQGCGPGGSSSPSSARVSEGVWGRPRARTRARP